MMNDKYPEVLKGLLELYYKCDISDKVVDRAIDLITNMIDDECEACPVCGKMFLINENALNEIDANGDPACECQSPENIAAAIADMEIDFAGED